MNENLLEGEGYVLSEHIIPHIQQHNRGVSGPASTGVRAVADIDSALARDYFGNASGILRRSSKRNALHADQLRSAVEAESKPTRSGPEQASNKSRSGVEDHSKGSRSALEQPSKKNFKFYSPLSVFKGVHRIFAMSNSLRKFCSPMSVFSGARRIYAMFIASRKFHVCSLLRRPQPLPWRGLAIGVLALLLMALCMPAWAQQTPAPIEIGDYTPDFHTDKVLNHPDGTLKLSDYAGKLLILDFWATWCQPCIVKIPEMERLQQEFDGQLQFISITSQSKDEIQRFLDRMEKERGTRPDIPYIVEDNELKNAFPHGSIPHYVWLDGTGKVLAITGSEEVNETNVQQMLTEPIALARKTEVIRHYDRRQPLLFDMESIEGTDMLFNRAMTGYIPGIGGGMTQTINSKSTSPYVQGQGNYRRITVRNRSVAGLYQVAFMDGRRSFRWENTVLEVKDPDKVYTSKTRAAFREWAKKNTFCYELILPKDQAHRAWELMKEDLRRWFPQYTATVEMRATPSICLVRTTETDLLKSKGGEAMVDIGPFGGELRNSYLGYLTLELYIKGLKIHRKPVINLTGYRDPVDIEIEADLTSIESINEALEPYGLALVEQDREVETLVIRDSE